MPKRSRLTFWRMEQEYFMRQLLGYWEDQRERGQWLWRMRGRIETGIQRKRWVQLATEYLNEELEG